MEAVNAAKDSLCFRYILNGLGFPQKGPTPIYTDDEATFLVANHTRPATRTRHVDIRWFALQHWVELGLVILQHAPGTHNIADAMTKALGWILQGRHMRQLKGYNGTPYRK